MTSQSSCRSCDAPIVWCTTERGKSIPIDPDPHPEGNLRPVDDTHTIKRLWNGQRMKVLRGLEVDLYADMPRWRSHFASCDDPDRFRNPR